MKRIAPHFPIALLAVLGWLLLATGGCGGGGSSAVDLTAESAEGFTLQLLDETLLAGADAGEFTLALSRQAAEVEVRVRVADARQLKACYFVLSYDADRYDPLVAEGTGLLSGTAATDPRAASTPDASDGQSSLELAVMTEPGTVHFGEVLTRYQDQTGFSGDGVLATVRFALRPFTPRQASAPPVNDASQTEAHWDSFSRALSWDYYCTGDYDQNSEVGVTDLTPLGANFGDVGPFNPLGALSVIDGDSNGELNVSDITPIGAGFGGFVEGYEVYASFDSGNLPEDNGAPPTLAPMDFVPFGEHLGNPLTQRLTFHREYPELEPGTIVWVRPVSDEQAGTPSTAEAAMPYDWVINCPSGYSAAEASIDHISLARISGLPAVLFLDNEDQQLLFQRALDASGMVWNSELVVDSSANSHFASSMIEVSGHAAVCHHESETGQVEYTRASDLTGNAWSEPYVIDTTASGGWDCHLLMVHDHPAVCYADLAAAQLLYASAEDPLGESWSAPMVVADLGSSTPVGGSWSSPAMIAEHPAIAYYHPGAQELRFIRATDPLGESWGDVILVAGSTDVGRYCSLAEIHEAPAVSFLGDSGLAYVRALDAAGEVWGDQQEIDSRFGTIDHLDTSLALIGDHPAISYYSGETDADLLFVRAVDPFGEIWEAPQTIDSYNRVGRSACLLEQEDRPTVAYLDESARQVMYAHSGAEIDYPPVARLSVYPAPAEVGEDVTLDASLSYAQQGELEIFEWDLDGDGTYEVNSGPESTHLSNYGVSGRFFVGVRVTDQDGLAAEDHVSLLVGVPGSPPTAVLTADPADVVLGQNIHFSAADSSDDGAIELYEWDLAGDGDFELDTGDVAEVDFEYSIEGVFNPAVRITDNIGLKDITSQSVNVGVLNERPVPVLTATPQQGNPPFTVNLDGSASYDPDGTITAYEWDLDDDGLFELNTGATATAQWLCEQHGDQRVRLRVTDNLQAKATIWMLIGSNQAPIAMLTASAYNGDAPYAVTVDCSASHDPDGSIVHWGIDLQNDGRFNAQFTGQPTSWNFTNIWNGATKVRLKVKDNEGATSSAVITVHANRGWHIRTIDPMGHTGLYNSLEIINGHPGIAYFEYYSSNLKFVRATDTYGYSGWAMPVNLGAIGPPGTGSNYGYVSLAWVNGAQPAIAFAGSLNNGSYYAVAKDSLGASWHPFVTSSTNNIYGQPVLGVINQKPALFYGDYFYGLYHAAAKDSQGLQWNPPAKYNKYGGCSAMTIVNGNPAIVYSLANSTYTSVVLQYCRATQPDGSKWGVPVVIDSSDDPGAAALTIITGRPAVAYVAYVGSSTVGYEVRYKRADNQNGTSWASPAKVVKLDGRTMLGLEEINGRPAIGLVTCQGSDVMYFRAEDAAGNSWPAGQVVDDLYKTTKMLIGLGPEGEMIEINDYPAMSYCDPVKGDLKYAVLE